MSSTTYSSAPPVKPCSPQPAIPNVWVWKSASSPCSIAGVRTFTFIPIYTAWFPGGGLSADHDRWISSRPRFLLPVQVLSCLFRRQTLRWLVDHDQPDG